MIKKFSLKIFIFLTLPLLLFPFSVWAEPSIMITYPQHGQIFRSGETYNISWRATGIGNDDTFRINEQRFDGHGWRPTGNLVDDVTSPFSRIAPVLPDGAENLRLKIRVSVTRRGGGLVDIGIREEITYHEIEILVEPPLPPDQPPPPAEEQVTAPPANQNIGAGLTIQNPLGNITDVPSLILAIIRILRALAIAVAPIFIILAAYHYITSAGEQKKIKQANDIIIWVIAGIVLLFAAELLVGTIRGFFVPQQSIEQQELEGRMDAHIEEQMRLQRR